MNKKPTIRIIKRDERKRPAKASKTTETIDIAPADATRRMAKTVTAWVREFKQKGNNETERVLTALFEKSPHPNEA